MTNVEFELAEQFALHTGKHCFVTGKAGTGKTTLLKRLVERTQKNVVVVAPTGVAAVNAGGVTIHSMFGLPLACCAPTDDFVDPNIAVNRHWLLHEHLRLRSEKRDVLRKMELLIVDEVSMVRCDVLDAVDLVLRAVRGNRQPFGGTQVLLIGDAHQLPPVAKPADWNVLKDYYCSPYFFDSLVWPQLDAARIELTTIYRQSDTQFLELLNNVRNRRLAAEDYRRLRERYDPEFKPQEPGYVLLSTHNSKADGVNAAELANLAGKTYSFVAEIEGDFPEHLFPCDEVLRLKAGAQVMFIRNDTEGGAYYNGKLAVVKRIHDGDITVTFRDSGEDYILHRETWENIGYGVDEETGKVVKEELGRFSQYPLRLAWAITIHKSQGLTFDKVIVDAGRSFAAGQVYVALSRCRTLEGIVLHSLITPEALPDDPRIEAFSASHHAAGELRGVLAREKTRYAQELLLRLFVFSGLSAHLDEWASLIDATKLPDRNAARSFCEAFRERMRELDATAEKFHRQLRRLIAEPEQSLGSTALLKERCGKAIAYFTEQIAIQLAAPLREHIASLAYKKKVRRYVNHLQRIEDDCWRTIECLYGARFLDESLYSGEKKHSREKHAPPVTSVTSASKAQGGTFNDTLELHRQGKTVEEIAVIRGLAVGTIKSHFARWIERGEIDVYSVLPATLIDPVLAFLRENVGATVTAVRTGTGERFDYNDIRMVLAHSLRGGAGTGKAQV